MKKGIFSILMMLLLIGANANFLRYLQSSSSKNTYDYSKYTAEKTNQNLLSSDTVACSTADKSVVYITNSGITIEGSTLTKESGDSSNTENSEFYGVNAAVLVQGGGLTMTGGTISTKAKGANALCATNNGKVTISGTTITSTASSSGRGLHATYGGNISATNVEISSTGGSCATLATDRGEGTVTCTKCQLSTGGKGSPLIYSTGQITVSETTGTSSAAQAVVVEGKNTATITGSSDLKCDGGGNRDSNADKCGIMLYQSMSGDADSGTSTFNCESSTVEILSTSSVYRSAPMFFITNTDAAINLKGCTFTYGSGVFLNAGGTSEWGSTGSNGGVVTLTLKNQNIEGNFVVDGYSGLTIIMESSSIKGTINTEKTAAKLNITLDSASTITLTGNSYYTSLTNAKTDGSNLVNGTYSWTKTEEKEISRPSGNSGGQNGRPDGRPGSSSNNTSGSNVLKYSIILFMFILFLY